MEKESKIYVAGHKGLVGSAIIRILKSENYTSILTKTHQELDLTNQEETRKFFRREKPEYVFLSAAKVGGIQANNSYPADFIYTNLMIESNMIKAAYDYNVKKLLFLGSSCIYPKLSSQPIKEEYLLTGPLEPTNEAYAIAKIAGLKMCQFFNKQYGTNFISAMPTNIYGPNDNYDLETSHVLAALIRKFHEAKVENKPYVEIWGTGSQKREFLYVDDLADALLYLMNHYEGNETINVGTGKDISIKELALLIKKIVGFDGKLKYESSKPDGTPRKVLDVSKLKKLGWQYKTSLSEGIKLSLEDYKKQKK